MKLPLTAIYYFDSVARHLSYSKAAKELHVTHSAVIAQVKKLENWLEVPLLKRQSNSLVLTEKGLWLADSLKKSISTIRNSITTVRQNNTITIKTIPSLASNFLLPNLQNLKKEFPSTNFNINYASNGEVFVDLVLGYSDGELKGGEWLLFDGETIPVCGKNYKYSIEEFNIEDSGQYEYLHDTNAQAWIQWFNYHADKEQDLSHLDKGSFFGDFNLMRVAAINNSGIALCPKNLIVNDLHKGKLIQLSSESGNHERKYFISSISPDNPRTQDVQSWLIDAANSNKMRANEI